MGEVLTVGQVTARTGVAVSALHFYEAKGLIRSLRTAGNQRRYPREVLRPQRRTGAGCRCGGKPSSTSASPG